MDTVSMVKRNKVEHPLIAVLEENGVMDALVSSALEDPGVLTGPGSVMAQVLKAVLERSLDTELTEHMGYEKHQCSGNVNSRNGYSSKTLDTQSGPVTVDIPRDRDGSFVPKLVPKHSRRLDGLEGDIISLYAHGMTVRDIRDHLEDRLGSELSHDTISKICDTVLDEVGIWQNRPLDEFYPVLFIDAIVVKIRDGAHVKNKAAHVVLGVDMKGVKHVLGIWISGTEGAKFWAGVFAELMNRGLKDVLIVCADGLKGIDETIEKTWPGAVHQTCVVHLIRNALNYVSYKDKRAVAAALKNVYTAANAGEAEMELQIFQESDLGRKYPQAGLTFTRAWEKFIPFLAFKPATRKMIYTTNAIESLNYQLRKVTKNRGHFPNDEAAIKMLWLAITTIERKHEKKRTKNSANIEGTQTQNWIEVLNELAQTHPEKIEKYL